MSLSRKSINRLRAVKEAILTNPEFYNQQQFVDPEPVIPVDCGTTCCIAGWADFLYNPAKAHLSRAKTWIGFLNDDGSRWSQKPFDWEEIGARALNIDGFEARQLFADVACWPDPFSFDYSNAATPLERARVAAARIERFIATDGQE